MKECEQVAELGKIGRALVDKTIHSMKCKSYPFDEQMDLVLKAGNIIKLLDWLEGHSLENRE